MTTKLQGETGQSPARRVEEAEAIIDELMRGSAVEEMNSKEREFVEGMAEKFEMYGDNTFISPKQLFWLRDLKEKYL